MEIRKRTPSGRRGKPQSLFLTETWGRFNAAHPASNTVTSATFKTDQDDVTISISRKEYELIKAAFETPVGEKVPA